MGYDPALVPAGTKGAQMKLTLGRIAEFIGATGEFDHHAEVVGYSIDSRTAGRG